VQERGERSRLDSSSSSFNSSTSQYLLAAFRVHLAGRLHGGGGIAVAGGCGCSDNGIGSSGPGVVDGVIARSPGCVGDAMTCWRH
jgi:hypothetical protein